MESDFDHVNLRYLDCFTLFKESKLQPFYLPPSISRLWSLQTLIVKGSDPSLTVTAPDEFWEMLQLRHLEIEGIRLPDPLPSDDDRLVLANLQTLIRVTNFRLSEEVCKRVSNIKELKINYIDWGLKYSPHNLRRLHKLESLSCEFSEHRRWCDVARSLTFPDSLKELSLCKSRLQWEELSTMVGSLPLLEVLNLKDNAVVGSEWNAVEGKFILLKSFTVCSCRDLVNFNADSFHFPALIDLALIDLPNMNELPSSIGKMASLRRISLGGCSAPLAASAMRMLVEQVEEFGNEELQLEVSFGPYRESLRNFEEIMREEGLSSSNLQLSNNYYSPDFQPSFEVDPEQCTVM